MTAEALEQQTYLPEQPEQLASVASFLLAHESRHGTTPEPRYFLAGAQEGDQVEVPEALHMVLLQVVEALRSGHAVTVAPQSSKLTTQQAADLLGVSRPTVVRLIDQGELPSERIGSRRKVLLRELLDYRERRRQRQYDAITATAVELDAEDDPAAVREQLKAIRQDLAARRRDHH
ncbi:helix-turn-helix domain-containing protein [Kribbella sp. NPDC058245]|uniref:helix-turn-helix domain-containing protein n=1 Tax=Kribbella sp. NPDC058245 TaxID=3346399 RepID=UPI0036E760CD